MKEKIVYIIGAGFSAPLGLPVMSNFLEKAKDMYFGAEERYPHFKSVFDTIKTMSVCKNYYSADLFNIEEILSILEMNQIFTNNSDKNSFVKFIIDVIKFYTPKIESYGSALPSNWNNFVFGNNRLHNDYGFFTASLHNFYIRSYLTRGNFGITPIFEVEINDKHDYDYSIITLNYDTVFENFLDYLKREYKSSIDFNFYTENNNDNKYPFLIKLHGNVSTNKIIPPTWNKILFDEDIKKSWTYAHKLIEEANQIRILGYSLPVTDSYIKYLFKSAVINSNHLKAIDVICLDNPSQEVKKRYDDFIVFNKYRFKSANITTYLSEIKTASQNLIKVSDIESSVNFNKLETAHNSFMNRLAI